MGPQTVAEPEGRPAAAALPCALRLSPAKRTWVPLGDHLRPQTSCSWPRSVAVTCSRTRTSWLRISESRPPVDRMCWFQDSADTRAAWPVRLRTGLARSASQIWVSELDRPTATCLPSAAQEMEET